VKLFHSGEKRSGGEREELVARLRELQALPALPGVGYEEEIAKVQGRLESLEGLGSPTAAWKTVSMARAQNRPQVLDYIPYLAPDFVELHGDRVGGDDHAIVGGVGSLDGRAVVLVGHQKGHDLKERQLRNFGMARPEGYRKAQRLFLTAERLGLPVITLVDTPGAFPGLDAERAGQAGAIARTLQVLAGLKVPTVAFVIGEGGSGGALALALCDRVFMLENAIYSVITPEGCAAILWRDAAAAPRAAEALRLTADDLLELGLIDGIVPEPRGGAPGHARTMARRMLKAAVDALAQLRELTPAELCAARRRRYLAIGGYAGPEPGRSPSSQTVANPR